MQIRKFLPMFFLVIFLMHQPLFTQTPNNLLRVEPPFWWVGMKHAHLQLQIHGENISELAPSISYPGVTLGKIEKVENPNYLFLDLHFSKDVKPGVFPIELHRENELVLSYDYQLKERKPHSAKRRGFSNKDIIYLITPDRFANGDPGNDTIPGMRENLDRSNKAGRHGGDIQGIIDHLHYIADMGFTAIWLNPVLENNMAKYSYHGYSTTDFYKVDPHFGTNQDYQRLSREARKRNILLIKDMIANHCGLNHWWTNDLPTSDWYNFQHLEKKPYSTHFRTTLADPYAADIDQISHSNGWFDTVTPDLNQRNPLLANYIIQNSIWWIEFADLGGIRQDTYSYADADFMREWSRRVMQEYPNFNIVGEEWTKNPAIVSRWQVGKKNANGYVSHLPSLMDFPLHEALIRALKKKAAPYSNSFTELYEMLANDFLYSNPYNLVMFVDNHDTPRFINHLNERDDFFRMGLIYLFTTRGIPQIYYGTEIMLGNPENSRDHAVIRTDMPGGWAGDSVNAFSGAGLSKTQEESKAFLKKLVHLRKNTTALQTGGLKHFAPMNETYLMIRYDDESRIVTIFNKNPQETAVSLERFAEVLVGATSARDVLTDRIYDLHGGSIDIPGNTALMLLIE